VKRQFNYGESATGESEAVSLIRQAFTHSMLTEKSPIRRPSKSVDKTPTGLAEIVRDDLPVAFHRFFSSQSFWKAGSDRRGSQSGSSLKSAGVTLAYESQRHPKTDLAQSYGLGSRTLCNARPTFEAIITRRRSRRPIFQPKHQKAAPTNAKQAMLSTPCTICPPSPQKNSP
jgi:hypothetical protein